MSVQHYIDWLLWWLLPERLYRKLPDHCEVCKGAKGGVRGNENVTECNGRKIVICDYCSAADLMRPPP